MNPSRSRQPGCAKQPGCVLTQRVSRILCLLVAAASASAQPARSAPPARLNPERIVREWAAASQAIAPPGKSARKRTVHAQRHRHNGHQIALIVEFRGPVDADQLLARYRFTAAKRVGQAIRLTAVPRDDVERLFVRRWELTVDVANSLPASLAFPGTSQQATPQTVALFTRRQRKDIAQSDQSIAAPLPAVKRVAAVDSTKSAVVRAAGVQSAEQRMPLLVGLPWKDVRAALQRAGYTVRLRFGPPSSTVAQSRRVHDQFPGPGERLEPRATVILTIHDAPPTPRRRTP